MIKFADDADIIHCCDLQGSPIPTTDQEGSKLLMFSTQCVLKTLKISECNSGDSLTERSLVSAEVNEEHRTSEMIYHHGASLSKQHTADSALICHGTQQDLSLLLSQTR